MTADLNISLSVLVRSHRTVLKFLRRFRSSAAAACLLLAMFMGAAGQSGGGFEISQAVMSPGGNLSSGGPFILESTSGQPAAGKQLGSGPFAVTPGFWTFTAPPPTAAMVTISGHVTTADGSGIRNVKVSLTGPDGDVRLTRTAALGYYQFDQVQVGRTYIVAVSAKRFTFSPSSMAVTVTEDITGLDFVADVRR